MIEKAIYGIMIVLIFLLGWFGNSYYIDYSNKKLINGLWIPEKTKTEAIKTSLEAEGTGNWICINVKGDTYKDVIDTCTHEASHELFARTCEENVTKCMDGIGK